jgi:hypothetical protein
MRYMAKKGSDVVLPWRVGLHEFHVLKHSANRATMSSASAWASRHKGRATPRLLASAECLLVRRIEKGALASIWAPTKNLCHVYSGRTRRRKVKHCLPSNGTQALLCVFMPCTMSHRSSPSATGRNTRWIGPLCLAQAWASRHKGMGTPGLLASAEWLLLSLMAKDTRQTTDFFFLFFFFNKTRIWTKVSIDLFHVVG